MFPHEKKNKNGENFIRSRFVILVISDISQWQITFVVGWLVGWLVFYGISTFVGYLMPNLFLCK